MRVAGVLLTWALWVAAAATGAKTKDGPTFSATGFDHPPSRLRYFEDSDVVIFQDATDNNVFRSADAGATWARVDDVPAGEAFDLVMHDFDQTRAYILTEGIEHYRTSDRGKTWEAFRTDVRMSLYRRDILHFHADDPDRIIFNGMDCTGLACDELAVYTTDGFETPARFLRGNTAGCWWAKASPLFTTGDETLDRSRVLCIAGDPFSPFRQDQRLLVSDNFFDDEGADTEWEPMLDTDKTVQGVVSIAAVQRYILAASSAANTDEMALFVSDDSTRWHRAVFPASHRVAEEAYTVLESTPHSIQIDVMNTRPSNPMGVLFTSNSNGTYFSENVRHTNRNRAGHVDFEAIAGIQGIFLVNTVANWEEVERDALAEKHIISNITFDDGRSFEPVTAIGGSKGERSIHLHSVTDLSNLGRVFSSPAPGLVMAVGNTGDRLRDYWEGNLYVSDDAGRTWTLALEGPHKYEFGDQGSVLVAVRDSETADVGEISYSLDHGQEWTTVPLPDGQRIRPLALTTTPDSAGLGFMLVGETDDHMMMGMMGEKPWRIITLDFDGLHEATCTESDMEDWFARVDDEKKPTCLMGHTQRFHRRKKNAECFIKQAFRDPEVETNDCDCTDLDYECDYNFVRDATGKQCVPQTALEAPAGSCEDETDDEATFTGPSGWRKIPGNSCRSSGDSTDKEKPKKWPCADSRRPPSAPATGLISQTVTRFEGEWETLEKHYLERGSSSTDSDETVIAWPRGGVSMVDGAISITHDHGKTWAVPEELRGQHIVHILPHPQIRDVVFFVTATERVWYTVDRGRHFHSFLAPYEPDISRGRLRSLPLRFHPDNKDWLLWVGTKCDGDGSGFSSAPQQQQQCYTVASFSKDRGDHWQTAVRNAARCEFTGSEAYRRRYPGRKAEQILCLRKTNEDDAAGQPKTLVVTDDWFDTQEEVVFVGSGSGGGEGEEGKGGERETGASTVIDFRTMAEFIVAATEHPERGSLAALASLDGRTFAEARFPANFEVPHQHAYTVLDSSTHAVNLFVVTETRSGREMGAILKSNSNGTSYVLSAAGVNCDAEDYVDFEKVPGLEGVALVNVVANRDNIEEGDGSPKKLQTRITHNDGAEWAYLPPPARDVDKKSFSCSGTTGSADCALHLHGYTEREDRARTFSTEGAVGIMFGWGNVGDSLSPLDEADTFMTSDAGISWRMVRKGRWTWSFGDQGAIIVLAQTTTTDAEVQTNEIIYSLDSGATWAEPYQFSEEKVSVLDVTALRSGGSRDFLLWAKTTSGYESTYIAVNLDFSGFSDRVCKHDASDAAHSDYDVWSPAHPLQPDGCLFGHVSQYLRKKPGRTCYNDNTMRAVYAEQNCSCTRQDFECNYNYELDNHGACRLVDGLEPTSLESWCAAHPDAVEFWEASAYRRIPLTTCAGGRELDKTTTVTACPGHQDEFDRTHRGPSGVAIFFAVTLPIAAAVAVGWWVWRNWSGKFGQIRLGESSAGVPGPRGTGALLDSDKPWVRYPVIVVSAAVAVLGALPLVVAGLWDTARSAADRWGLADSGRAAWSRLRGRSAGGGGARRFTTRDSFARGRGDYAIVDEDEGELLGEDSDEDV